MGALIGGWATGAVVGRRPAGPVRDAVHSGSGVRGLLVVVDERFTVAAPPDHDLVARTAVIAHPALVPMLDAGLLEDGTRWYVTAAPPAPVLDAEGGCSPRRAVLVAEGVARALVPLHAAGVAHGLVGAHTVVPVAGRHRDGGSGSTLLLDAGVAPLLGDGADALAEASGVVRPADRGAAADVHALGGLLLRMLTAAAPAGAALDALPPGLRSLLSAMLEPDPAARPTALAAAGRLADLQEGLPATAPIELPASVPTPVQRAATAPTPVQRPVTGARPVQRAATAGTPVQRGATAPSGTRPPAPEEARVRVPAPVHAAAGVPQPDVLPAVAPEAPRAMRTGATPVVAAARRPRSVRRALVVTGGLGLAALLVGVVTHLPAGGDVGVHAAAAGAGDALTGAGAPVADRTPALSSVATTSPTRAPAPKAAKHRAEPSAAAEVGSPAAASAAPSFARPAAAVPSPLTAATRKPAPSRTATPTRTPASSRTPSSSTPSKAPKPSSSTGGTRTPSTTTPAAPTTTPTRTTTPPSETPTAPSGSTAPTREAAPVDPPVRESTAPSEPVGTPSSLPSATVSVPSTAAAEETAAAETPVPAATSDPTSTADPLG